MNINIRSLVNNKHLSSLESVLNSLNILTQVGINKTWKKSTSFGSYKNLAGYSYISNYRRTSFRGVATIVSSASTFKKMHTFAEFLF